MEKKMISVAPLYARIQEEMRSYFSSGSVDTLMFPIWTLDCLSKFENTYMPLQECVMDICDHKCELPCDFKSVREVWMTTTFHKGPVTSPHVYYYQTDCRISPEPSTGCSDCVPGEQCFPSTQTPTEVALPSLCDVPSQYIVTHKVMNQMIFSFDVCTLLKPGNFKTIGKCHEQCANRDIYSLDTFDISGGKLSTSFRTGTIYMAYYGTAVMDQEDGTYMIPDNYPFYEYVYHYLRFMIYQQLFDQSTDETFNQIKAKRDDSESRLSTAYINARNYAMSGDIYSIQRSITRSYNRNNRFLLPGPNTRINRHGRR